MRRSWGSRWRTSISPPGGSAPASKARKDASSSTRKSRHAEPAGPGCGPAGSWPEDSLGLLVLAGGTVAVGLGAEELDAADGGVLGALRAILGLPLAVDEPPRERDFAALGQVLGAGLRLLVEGGDVEVER